MTVFADGSLDGGPSHHLRQDGGGLHPVVSPCRLAQDCWPGTFAAILAEADALRSGGLQRLVQRLGQPARGFGQEGRGIEDRQPGAIRLAYAGVNGQEAEHRKPR